MSVSRSIFALVSDVDRAYFGRGDNGGNQIGFIEANMRAVFGRTYAAEPHELISQLAQDEAIAAADTLLSTVPNQLGVEYNAHVIESILTDAPPNSAGVDHTGAQPEISRGGAPRYPAPSARDAGINRRERRHAQPDRGIGQRRG